MREEQARVLIIYTGGTIGMKRTDRGYAPVQGWFASALHGLSQFQDPDQPPGTTPLTALGRRISYDVLEYEPLLDSTNMQPRDWVRIAEDIAARYDDYDAFIVLHGTDTMAWTAAALSFMLVNLSKTVILTGSQIPLVEIRNDALDNLLGALMLAAHYQIPEVGLFFHGRLMRGNRTRKVDAAGLDAFASSNLPPLAELGIRATVAWHLIQPRSPSPLRVRPITEREVSVLRLFPGISIKIVRNHLAEPLRGLVLETFGAGNAPDNRPDLLNEIRAATARGVVVVNVTQCDRGSVTMDYAVGAALVEAGVVSGGDMTTEAALTKLAYLLSLELSLNEVRRFVSENIRGELTPRRAPRFSARERQFVDSVAQVLTQGMNMGADPETQQALYPILLCSAAARGDLAALHRIAVTGVSLGSADYDGRTALHLAAAEGHVAVVRYLLDQGASASALDRWGTSPLDEALRSGRAEIAALLAKQPGAPSPSLTE
jgi:lysophospholipase